MTFIDILRRSWHNIGHAKVRVGLTAAALAIGAATMTLALAISQGASASIQKSFGEFKNNFVVIKGYAAASSAGSGVQTAEEADRSAQEAGTKSLTNKNVEQLKQLSGVQQVIPLNYFTFDTVELNGKAYKAPEVSPLTPLDELSALVAGKRENLKGNTVIIPERYARQAGVQDPAKFIGQKITFTRKGMYDYYSGKTGPATSVSLTVVGVTKSSNNSEEANYEYAYMAPEATSTIATQSRDSNPESAGYSQILILSDETRTEQLKTQLKAQGYEVESRKESIGKALEAVKGIRVALLFFAGIAIFTAIFGVINTQLMAVMERTREIGIMKALGLSKGGILLMFSVEAGWIGFIGSIIGTLIALPITALINHVGNEVSAAITIPNFLLVVVVLIGIAVLSGLLPARRAAKLDPVAALRNE